MKKLKQNLIRDHSPPKFKIFYITLKPKTIMKTFKLLLASFFLSTFISNAQIAKHNWLMGGNLGFSYITAQQNSKTTEIDLQPNVGYFIVDKLAIGTLLNYNYTKSKDNFGTIEIKSSNIGPFLKYYILNKDKGTNIFLESAYNFSLQKENKNTEFSSKIGVAFFLNSSVAFEASIRYGLKKFKYPNNILPDSSSNNFIFGLGFQIHLEKEK